MTMRSTLNICGALIAAFAATAAGAEESPHTLTANVGLYSQYVFRGLAQSHEDPAIQGGADYSHASGVYAGTWLSNVSWFSDTNAGNTNSLEWDLYGGFRKSWDNGFSGDVGYLRYEYPGSYPALPAGTVKPNTDEAYVAVGWKWASLKYSYAFSNLFGVEDSEGSDYLDLTVTVPLNERFTFVAHAGRQAFKGASTYAVLNGTTNDALYSYEDYRATVNVSLGQGWTASLTATTSTAKDAGYTVLGENLGDDQVVVGIARTF
jgi:uncharacterized protein (TIGR02001 family)